MWIQISNTTSPTVGDRGTARDDESGLPQHGGGTYQVESVPHLVPDPVLCLPISGVFVLLRIRLHVFNFYLG